MVPDGRLFDMPAYVDGSGKSESRYTKFLLVIQY